jgi:predicted CoA-binding protein
MWIEMMANSAYAIIPKISLAVNLGFFNGAHGTPDIINDNIYKYHPRVEDLKEIDVDALEDYTETPIIKTFEKSHIIFESFSIFTAITSDKAETNLKNIVSTYKKIAVYGAGMLGYMLYAIYDDLLSDKVCCFVDDNPKDVELMGKPILKPQDMPDDIDLVIISPQYRKAYENMKEKIGGKKAVWLRDLVF